MLTYIGHVVWSLYEKNDFAEISENLATNTDLKIILMEHQNIYV